MKTILPILSTIFLVVLFTGSKDPRGDEFRAEESSSLSEVLEKLGDNPVNHKPDLTVAGVSAERGADLVLRGITKKPKGGKTRKQSKHFVCTSCHNVQKEDPDLSISDPEARLEYALDNNLPFLQGTTLYGAVNRTRFYNGDYEKKYGDLVKNTRNNLREAIQLCAVECSQGRRLKSWEMESVLAYLWTLELKLQDLGLDSKEYEQVNQALSGSGNKPAAVEMLKSHYLEGSPATFLEPPADRTKGYEPTGDPDRGKHLYELSCLHCHEEGRYSFFKLDDSRYSFQHLNKHLPRYSRYSIYQVGRYGTSPTSGKGSYMPNYTEQKMSNQQMEDLRAYIELQAR